MEQLDIFGGATTIDTTPAKPGTRVARDVQASLFRPDVRTVRAPKPSKAPEPIALDPALHTDTLI